MRRRHALLLSLVALLVGGQRGEARQNPLRSLEQQLRPEIIIVLDTSDSMGRALAGSSPLALTKRALRRVVTQFRGVASFGLVTFRQRGYFRYVKVAPAAKARGAVFLPEWVLRSGGSWTRGLGWQRDAAGPRPSFRLGARRPQQRGVTYALVEGSPSRGDSLYRGEVEDASKHGAVKIVYRRASWGAPDNWGRVFDDGRVLWRYQGSYYGYGHPARPAKTRLGAKTALGATTPLDAKRLPSYRGPLQWIGGELYRYQVAPKSDPAAISGSTAGDVVVGLVKADGKTPQASFDHALGRLLDRLGEQSNGGLIAAGGTATPYALAQARAHIAAHPEGCRQRFVLLLSDGASTAAASEALELFNVHGVRTVGVAVPGTSPSGRAELNAITDCGDDGDCRNQSAKSISAASESELVDALREIIFGATRGNYATAPAGVTTGNIHGRPGDVSLIPALQFPGWRGHLRARDQSREPEHELWEAGALLHARAFSDRKIYSGRPALDGGKAFLVYDGHAVDSAMLTLWPRSACPPPPDLKQAIAWALGKHRRWKLPPMVRSVPAVVGPPQSTPGRLDQAAFAAQHAGRQRLVYVASNEGILHAFDAKSGKEVWGYLVPHLLPKLHALYRAGGQDEDPSKFVYLLASSPRVEDVKIDGLWKTLLVLTDGPGGNDFVVLDITTMPTCDGKQPAVCKGKPAPKVLFDSAFAKPVVRSKPGRTPPALLCKSGACDIDALARGLLAKTVALTKPGQAGKVLRSYQASSSGRLFSYEQGAAARGRRELIDLGKDQPLFFAPAVMLQKGRTSYIALASGAYQEDGPQPAPSQLKIYLDDGQTNPLRRADTLVDCSVSNICRCLGAEAGVLCMPPSNRAKPIGSPLLTASPTKGRSEASFVYYDPPAESCGSTSCARDADCGSGQSCLTRQCKTPCAVATVQLDCPAGSSCRAGFCTGPGWGDSYVFRISLDASTSPPTARLASAVKWVGVQAAGLTVIGGGAIFALAASGRGATPAGLQALGSSSLSTALAGLGQAAVESWREIR